MYHAVGLKIMALPLFSFRMHGSCGSNTACPFCRFCSCIIRQILMMMRECLPSQLTKARFKNGIQNVLGLQCKSSDVINNNCYFVAHLFFFQLSEKRVVLAKAAAGRQRARSMEQTKFIYQGPNDERGGVSADQKPPDHVARSEEEEGVKSLTVASGGRQNRQAFPQEAGR